MTASARAAIKYLIASSANAISIIERDGVKTRLFKASSYDPVLLGSLASRRDRRLGLPGV